MSDDAKQPVKYQLNQTVVLVGMMGCGKTAIGRALAAKIGVPFLDSDAALEEAATQTIAEIFARDGEAFFRAREAEVIARLLSGAPAVLSTGGGAFMAQTTRDVINNGALAVWLNADLDTLWERVRHKDTRPLLRTADPRATLEEIYHDRVPVYAQASLHVAITQSASIDETTQSVIDTLVTQSNALEVHS